MSLAVDQQYKCSLKIAGDSITASWVGHSNHKNVPENDVRVCAIFHQTGTVIGTLRIYTCIACDNRKV